LANGKALVKAGGRASIVEAATGKPVTATTFDEVCSQGRGVVGVVVDGQMGAVDENGHWLIEPKYEPWGFNFFHDFSQVRSRGKWGFVDAAGNAIEARFDEVRRFERGVAWGRIGDTWCPIDRRGNKVPALACQDTDPNPSQAPRPETTQRPRSDPAMFCRLRQLDHAQR
jgi:hypothetical protein